MWFPLLSLFLLLSSSPSGATKKIGNNPTATPLPYWHNWADSRGVSHFTKCQFTNWTYVDFLPNSAPLFLDQSLSGASASVVLLELPVGWVGDWHKDPVPQLVMFLMGEGEWVTMDNATHTFSRGDVYFGEDQRSSMGHLSRNSGTTPLIAALIQFKQWNPTANQPCRLK